MGLFVFLYVFLGLLLVITNFYMQYKKRATIKINPLILELTGASSSDALRIISNTLNKRCNAREVEKVLPKKCSLQVSLDEDGVRNVDYLKKQKGARMHQICEIILIENFLKQFKKSD